MNALAQSYENMLSHIGERLGVAAGDVPGLLQRIDSLLESEGKLEASIAENRDLRAQFQDIANQTGPRLTKMREERDAAVLRLVECTSLLRSFDAAWDIADQWVQPRGDSEDRVLVLAETDVRHWQKLIKQVLNEPVVEIGALK